MWGVFDMVVLQTASSDKGKRKESIRYPKSSRHFKILLVWCKKKKKRNSEYSNFALVRIIVSGYVRTPCDCFHEFTYHREEAVEHEASYMVAIVALVSAEAEDAVSSSTSLFAFASFSSSSFLCVCHSMTTLDRSEPPSPSPPLPRRRLASSSNIRA
mmetsp:Transcript_2635/g.3842  ORF Transcript_2635/g.3842 Transcript_2635/m.3842 type:complete len:157 (-) Transcript_2635:1294-1764(-)